MNKFLPKVAKLRGTRLLKRIINVIREEPKRVVMEDGIITEYDSNRHYVEEFPACNTTGCIAGWACILSDGAKVFEHNHSWGGYVESRATRLLNLTDDERRRLFYATKWPEPFFNDYYKSKNGSVERANIVIRRIKHFLETRQ